MTMKTQPISRRALAAGLALAPVAGLPALASESGPSVAKLWDAWRAFIADYLDATARRDAAEKAMPFWAQPGPGNLYSDGCYRGETIYAPLDITIPPPDRPGDLSISRLVRRTLADCRRALEFRIKIFGDEAAAKKAYRAQLRKLARVRMAQRAEMRKVGLPELEQARSVALTSMFDTATSILECESCCADAIAAKITVAMWLDEPAASFERPPLGDMTYAIKALQPQLTGRIRADVGFLINRTDEDEEA
jgi:hypothetical protein